MPRVGRDACGADPVSCTPRTPCFAGDLGGNLVKPMEWNWRSIEVEERLSKRALTKQVCDLTSSFFHSFSPSSFLL